MVILLALTLFLCFDYRSTLNDTSFAREIETVAKKYDLDPDFVRAVIYQESRFNQWKRGSKGEYGLMQVLPGKNGAVAEWSRIHHRMLISDSELFDVSLNLEIGCWYLSKGLQKYKNYRCAKELALIYYNSGPSRAEAWKPKTLDGDVVENIQIRSTKAYVTQIMAKYRQYKQQQGDRRK